MATEVAQLIFKADTSQIKKADQQVAQLGRTTQKTTNVANDFGRRAGMAGIQVEQLSNQIAGGQNAIRAFGMQAADIGFILGTPLLGAVIGIGAAFGSMLVPSSERAKSAIEELNDISELLDQTFQETTNSTLTLSDEIVELAKRSESMALLKLAQSAFQVEDAIKAAGSAISDELFKVMSGNATVSVNFNKNLRQAGLSAQDLANDAFSAADAIATFGVGGVTAVQDLDHTVSSLSKRFDISRQQAVDLAMAVADFKTDRSVQNMDNLAQVITQLGVSAGDDANRDLVNLGVNLGQISGSALSADEKLQLINQAMDDFAGFTSRTGQASVTAMTSIDQLRASLDLEEQALEKAKDATISLAAAKIYLKGIESGLSQEQAMNLAQRYQNIQAAQEEFRQENRTGDAREKNINRLMQLSDKAFNQEQQLRRSYGRQIADLQTQRDSDVANAQLYNDAILGLETERDQKITAIRQRQADDNARLTYQNMDMLDRYIAHFDDNMITFRDIGADAMMNFEQSVGNAFEQFATGQASAEEALQMVTKSILGGVINALGQMVAQYIISQLAIESFTRTAAVSAATGTAMQAQATALQAGLNAFTSTAAIPIVGPALAPAAMATALSVAQPLAVAVGSMAMSGATMGGRALGGQVRPGESYVVGERGPEVLTMGNAMGRITTNESLRGSGTNMTTQQNVANVSFNINANDTRGFDRLLQSRRGQIVNIINQALNENGRSVLV